MKDVLEKVFMDAYERGLDVFVETTIPNQSDTEFIISRNSSILNKLEYYKKTYDDELVHNHCNDIKIIRIGAIEFNLEEMRK